MEIRAIDREAAAHAFLCERARPDRDSQAAPFGTARQAHPGLRVEGRMEPVARLEAGDSLSASARQSPDVIGFMPTIHSALASN